MNNTIDAITELLFIDSKIKECDLIFVFGNDWIDTMNDVAFLYKNKISEKILITGHSANTYRNEPESISFYKKGLELNIPKDSFILEQNATNTKENIEFSIPLIEEEIGWKNVHKILFVCKTFHTRRVKMTANNFFPKDIEYLFYPIKGERNITKNTWWIDKTAQARVLAEIKRIAEYSIKGDLSIFD